MIMIQTEVLHVAGDSLEILWRKTVNGQDYCGAIQSSPAIGDIDSDGKPEVVVLSDSGYVYALNGEDGSSTWVKHIGGGYSRGSSKTAPVLADVDQDGKLEIIARTNEDYLAVLKGENGEDDTVSRYFLGDDLVDETLSPCVGDVDGDGQLEILFQTESALLILSSSLSLEKSIQIPESALGVVSPALADLNSDNEQEILVAAGNTLFAFESNGDTLFEVPLVSQWAVAPAVGDIDGDGDAEIIGAYQSGLGGIVHVCDYWGQLGDIEWGMFHHDPRRTGCYAQPELGDTLKDDKIWSGNVVVYGDIIIDSSVTLTIEPGTTVEFDTTDAQSSGEDETKCELIINGTLKAEGTESNNIIFTSRAASPSKGDWYGIVFTDDTSDSNQISYCRIEYANKGISCSECSVDVFHSQLTQCFYGCYVCSSGTKLRLSHVTCDSCSYGAYIQTGKARLDTCSFVRNDVGVKCDATAHYFPQDSLKADWKGCTISNNVYGAIVDDASPIINYCHIDSNSQWGLQCLDDSDPVLGETRFIGYGDTSKGLGHSKSGPPQYPPGGGLFCTGTSTPIAYEGLLPGGSDYMRGRNVFTHLNGYAIYCGGQSNPKLGFQFLTSQGKNSIHDNSPYDVFNETGTTVKAEKNFWTAVADSSVPDSIYGSVDWVPTWKDSAGLKASWYTTRDGLFEKQSRSPARNFNGSLTKGGEHDSTGVAQEYNDQGTYYLMKLQYDNAISAFQYVIDHYADCYEANYALVHLIYCYKEAGYWSNINSYLENIAVSCSNPELENLALYLSISQLIREEQYQSALSRCQALLLSECDEDMERSLRLRLGTMYRYGLNNDQAAISAFRDFLFRYPVGPLSSIARIELEILGVSVPPGSVPEEPTAKPVVALPETYALYQNYPNPFNATTSIRYALPEDGRVSLKIFNILGQRVVTLVNERQPVGNYVVSWDGTNGSGSEVSSGIYFIRMEAGDFSRARKIVLLR
jgi:hypothetical protein